ncbi:hypothetical protein STEG23_021482 [Scotinomys teguina]
MDLRHVCSWKNQSTIEKMMGIEEIPYGVNLLLLCQTLATRQENALASTADSMLSKMHKQDTKGTADPYLTRTSSTILNRYGESGQPCLVPDLSGNALSFSPFNLMFAVGLL